MRKTITTIHHFDYHRVSTEHVSLASAYGLGGFLPHSLGGIVMMAAYVFVAVVLFRHSLNN